MARKKKTSKFSGRTGDSATRRKKEGSQYGYLNLPKGLNVFKEEPSTKKCPVTKLDILPYSVEEKNHPDKAIMPEDNTWYGREFKIHRNIGGENAQVVCLSTINKKCPICIAVAEMRQNEESSKEDIDALKARKRSVYFVIPRDHKELEEKVHIWDISPYLFQDLLDEELLADDDNQRFPDLENGLTLHIRFSEEKFGKNVFAEAARIDFKEREEEIDEAEVEDLPDILTILNILSYEELEAKFLGIEDEEEEKEDDKSEDDKDEDEEEIDENACKACKGTGEASNGDTCKPCDGTGEKKKLSKKDKEKAKRDARKKKEDKDDDDRCPHGHTFGKDYAAKKTKKDCDECDEWEDCFEETEKDD